VFTRETIAGAASHREGAGQVPPAGALAGRMIGASTIKGSG
jgi:hypothetical protein